MNIPITKPFFNGKEYDYIKHPIESGWLVQGGFVKKFEELFSSYTRIKYSKAVSSCTTALHMALNILGIKRGDKVIVPSFTYVASANAVEYTGGEVIFCDIDLKTFNIDTEKLQEILEKDSKKQIKAVMPVNLFGLCANLEKIAKIAEKYGIYVVEDSACGLGAYIEGKHSGSYGDISCFSFHPRKVITTGEGGMIASNNSYYAELADRLRNHGASKSDIERHKEKGGALLSEFDILGFNYRMTDLQAALGVAQMEKLDLILEKRRRIAQKYYESLKDSGKLILPYIPDGYVHSFQSFVCLYIGENGLNDLNMEKIRKLNIERNKLMFDLWDKGIGVRQGTHAVHTLGYYKNKYALKESDFPNSYAADRLSIALPLYAGMTEGEFDYVVEKIKESL